MLLQFERVLVAFGKQRGGTLVVAAHQEYQSVLRQHLRLERLVCAPPCPLGCQSRVVCRLLLVLHVDVQRRHVKVEGGRLLPRVLVGVALEALRGTHLHCLVIVFHCLVYLAHGAQVDAHRRVDAYHGHRVAAAPGSLHGLAGDDYGRVVLAGGVQLVGALPQCVRIAFAICRRWRQYQGKCG